MSMTTMERAERRFRNPHETSPEAWHGRLDSLTRDLASGDEIARERLVAVMDAVPGWLDRAEDLADMTEQRDEYAGEAERRGAEAYEAEQRVERLRAVLCRTLDHLVKIDAQPGRTLPTTARTMAELVEALSS